MTLLLQADRHHHPHTSVSSKEQQTKADSETCELGGRGFNRLFVSGSAATDACAVCWKDLETCGRDDTLLLLLLPAA